MRDVQRRRRTMCRRSGRDCLRCERGRSGDTVFVPAFFFNGIPALPVRFCGASELLRGAGNFPAGVASTGRHDVPDDGSSMHPACFAAGAVLMRQTCRFQKTEQISLVFRQKAPRQQELTTAGRGVGGNAAGTVPSRLTRLRPPQRRERGAFHASYRAPDPARQNGLFSPRRVRSLPFLSRKGRPFGTIACSVRLPE